MLFSSDDLFKFRFQTAFFRPTVPMNYALYRFTTSKPFCCQRPLRNCEQAFVIFTCVAVYWCSHCVSFPRKVQPALWLKLCSSVPEVSLNAFFLLLVKFCHPVLPRRRTRTNWNVELLALFPATPVLTAQLLVFSFIVRRFFLLKSYSLFVHIFVISSVPSVFRELWISNAKKIF